MVLASGFAERCEVLWGICPPLAGWVDQRRYAAGLRLWKKVRKGLQGSSSSSQENRDARTRTGEESGIAAFVAAGRGSGERNIPKA
jgi:hypothetical protein